MARDGILKRALRLLKALPEAALSPRAKRLRDEEDRAFPDAGAEVVWFSSGYVESPMSADQMERARDDDIVSLFDQLTDDTEGRHPDRPLGSLVGGSGQASQQFAEFSKRQPERALRIIGRFKPSLQERPAGYALAELGSSSVLAPADLFQAIRRMDAGGFSSKHFREGAAQCLNGIGRRAKGLDDCDCAMLEGWIQDWAGVESEGDGSQDVEPGPGQPRSILWGMGSFAILPAGNFPFLEAITLGYLLRDPPATAEWIAVLERHLQRREDVRIWKGLGRSLRYLRLADPVQATAFLRGLIGKFPMLMRDGSGVGVMAEIQSFLPGDLRMQVLADWLSGRWAEGPQAAGEVVSLRLCRDPGSDDARREVEAMMAGEIPGTNATSVRLGLAYTFAEAWREPELRGLVTPLMLSLLQGADDAIGNALLGAIWRTDPLPADEATDQLLRGFVATPGLLGSNAHSPMLDRLKSYLAEGDPALVFDVAWAILEEARPHVRDIRTAWAGQTSGFTELALALHRIPETREQGLCLFERLLEAEALGLEEHLLQLDRRSMH